MWVLSAEARGESVGAEQPEVGRRQLTKGLEEDKGV